MCSAAAVQVVDDLKFPKGLACIRQQTHQPIQINRAMARIAHLALIITASLLSCSTALPSHLAVSDPKLAWKLATGGEVVATGALSPDGDTFYVGSR